MNRSIIRTGTRIEEPPKQRLKAGRLEATFDAGQLRWVRWDGIEILRGISFLVRTPGWGTPAPQVTGLEVAETGEGFEIRYNALYGEPGRGVRAEIAINGSSHGRIDAVADITAEAAFSTNRTGFVVLHPLDGFAGTDVDVEHASGGRQRLRLPLEISPGQPVFDIRAITHQPRPGLRITTRFEGDVFEMEDHRNWSDASFKTYSRPIGLPYPYVLEPGTPVRQSVTVTLSDEASEEDVGSAVPAAPAAGKVLPAFALLLDRLCDAGEALAHADLLAALAPGRILLRHDFARGDDVTAVSDLAALLAKTGAELEVIAVLGGHDRDQAAQDLRGFAEAFEEYGITVAHIAAFAKVDEQSFQPGQSRPPHLAEAEIAGLLDYIFPQSRCGGGSPAFFTEFNRKRPDPTLAEYLTFATTPVVHAADDASVIETLQSLPHILHAATALAAGRPLAVGPTGIGARLNPYGDRPMENDPDARTGMAARDPRQRALFAAAWHVGYFARLAPWSVERFAFGAPTGPFGLVSTPQPYARDGWDGLPVGAVYPLFHVARWISHAAGGRVLEAVTDRDVARISWQKQGRRFALYANLSPEPVEISLEGWTDPTGFVLDETSAEAAALEPDTASRLVAIPRQVALGAYGVLFVNEEVRS